MKSGKLSELPRQLRTTWMTSSVATTGLSFPLHPEADEEVQISFLLAKPVTHKGQAEFLTAFWISLCQFMSSLCTYRHLWPSVL